MSEGRESSVLITWSCCLEDISLKIGPVTDVKLELTGVHLLVGI